VYSTLLFPPAEQTRCSEGQDGYEEFFDEEFAALVVVPLVLWSLLTFHFAIELS
jgi:hypothetical protein